MAGQLWQKTGSRHVMVFLAVAAVAAVKDKALVIRVKQKGAKVAKLCRIRPRKRIWLATVLGRVKFAQPLENP